MATQDKSGGYSNAAMTRDNPSGGHSQPPPPSYCATSEGKYGPPPQQYGAYPPPQGGTKGPYVTNQPQYGHTSSSGVIVHSAYNPQIVVAQPQRETGEAPDTACSLIFAILSIFFCVGGWPFAVVSIIFNRKAKGQVAMGQYTTARGSLRTAGIFIGVAVLFGIIGWVIFGLRLKVALDALDDDNYYYYRTSG
jgi:hypothetical protein